jgi:polysaccharide biosynthesis transport protein
MPPSAPQSTGLSLSDIYFILFRHKWKVVLGVVVGIAAGAYTYSRQTLVYESNAKLYIRYVLADKQISAVRSDDAKSPDQRGETIMTSESEILTSADIAKQVAQIIGPDKILAKIGGGKDLNLATIVIRKGLTVDVPPRSTVISISFKHPDAQVVEPVLREIITQYLKTHREVHQSAGIVGDFLTQETDQLRTRLGQTEDDLRKAREKAGIVSSIEETKRTYSTQIASVRGQILTAQADLAEKMAVQEALHRAEKPEASAPAAPAEIEKPIPADKRDEYAAALGRLDHLRKSEAELLLQFTPESTRVKETHDQVVAADAAKRKLEEEYPQLTRAQIDVGSSNPVSAQTKATDNNTIVTQIIALQAKIKALNSELATLTTEAGKVGESEVQISELLRRKALDEANYTHFSESLEQSRLDDAMGGNGHVSNIIPIESPTPPASDTTKLFKTPGTVALGAIALAIAWAFAIELYFDRSIKRPIDIERHFRIPLFLCLPDLKKRSVKGLLQIGSKREPKRLEADAGNTASTALTTTSNTSLRIYHETLRDRLIGYFESINLTHKPKLVGITSVGRGAGVTTTAGGLAQSLSETGEGNVLLVDMTAGQGSVQQFLKGEAVSNLDDLLESRNAPENEDVRLFVVAADSNSEQLTRNLPQRFSKLIPKLKASDFDYIIFDMPPVSQISITPRLANFMDMVLLVIESEKTDRDVMERATSLLAQSKTHIGTVLNKTRSYGSSALHQEFLYGT